VLPQTSKEFERGLMYRQYLAPQHGMLFLFDPKENTPIKMWMKNTLLPLDMLFIDSSYRIHCIVHHTIPLSQKEISCSSHRTKIIGVLEINAGEAKHYHLHCGDRIERVMPSKYLS
jgi:uncharacterized membrane protein (UPF0127 family)